MNAAQIKEVGLTLASGEQNTLIQDELPTFSFLLLSSESSEQGISSNATARLRELLYDAIINSFVGGNMSDFMLYQIKGRLVILPNRNLFSNSPADIYSSTQTPIELPIPKKSKSNKENESSNRQPKVSQNSRSVAGIPDDDFSSKEEREKKEETSGSSNEVLIEDPNSIPTFQDFTNSQEDTDNEDAFDTPVLPTPSLLYSQEVEAQQEG